MRMFLPTRVDDHVANRENQPSRIDRMANQPERSLMRRSRAKITPPEADPKRRPEGDASDLRDDHARNLNRNSNIVKWPRSKYP